MRVQLSRRDEGDERGAVALLTAVMMVALCVISAFSLDIGLAYASRMDLRTAADSGALAAAGVYATSESEIKTCSELAADAGLYAEANAAAQAVAADNYSTNDIATAAPSDISVSCGEDGLEVSQSVTANTETFFGQLVPGTGDTLTSTTTATALVDVPPAATGLRPLALCSSNLPDGTPSGVFKVDGPATGNGGGGGGPAPKDTDKGGVSDAAELLLGTDPTLKTDDKPTEDPDGDGLTNAEEGALGTDPTKADTDGDTYPDNTDSNPLAAALCPELADPGNWWTLQCPNASGNKDLANAILTGCDDPIEIVEGQGTKTGAELSSHLISNCNVSAIPANCLAADTGQINGNPVLGNFQALVDNQTPFVLPVFCGPPTSGPCTPVAIKGAETGTGHAGSNTQYPVYRMVGVTTCGYRFNTHAYNNGCDTWGGGQGDNYLLLEIHTVLVSGVTAASECSLGDECDGGLRRVQLVE